MKDKARKKEKEETDTEMLARIMVNGFEQLRREFKQEIASAKNSLEQGQEEIREELAGVREEVSSLKEEQKETNRTVKSYEKKQAGMLLSLDGTVHRSEFDGLVRRVEVLEK